MAEIYKKLNPKGLMPVVVLDAPDEFHREMASWPVLHLHHHLATLEAPGMLLAFVHEESEVEAAAKLLSGQISAQTVLWFAYPKLSAKEKNGAKHRAQLGRDRGWDALTALDLRPVSLTALNEEWSALCFKRAAEVKSRKKSQRRLPLGVNRP